jgi:hypothetical protein
VDAIRRFCRTPCQVSQYILQHYGGMLGKDIGGQMSKFLIDQLAYEMVFCGNGYESTGSKEDFEAFFETDPMTAVMLVFTLRGFHERKNERRTTQPCEVRACKYHVHTKTTPCKDLVDRRSAQGGPAVTDDHAASRMNWAAKARLPVQSTSTTPTQSTKQPVTVRLPQPSPYVHHSAAKSAYLDDGTAAFPPPPNFAGSGTEWDNSENTYITTW